MAPVDVGTAATLGRPDWPAVARQVKDSGEVFLGQLTQEEIAVISGPGASDLVSLELLDAYTKAERAVAIRTAFRSLRARGVLRALDDVEVEQHAVARVGETGRVVPHGVLVIGAGDERSGATHRPYTSVGDEEARCAGIERTQCQAQRSD